jgi:hypothetical protein
MEAMARLSPVTCEAALLAQWLYFAVRLRYAVEVGLNSTSIFLRVVVTAGFFAGSRRICGRFLHV